MKRLLLLTIALPFLVLSCELITGTDSSITIVDGDPADWVNITNTPAITSAVAASDAGDMISFKYYVTSTMFYALFTVEGTIADLVTAPIYRIYFDRNGDGTEEFSIGMEAYALSLYDGGSNVAAGILDRQAAGVILVSGTSVEVAFPLDLDISTTAWFDDDSDADTTAETGYFNQETMFIQPSTELPAGTASDNTIPYFRIDLEYTG